VSAAADVPDQAEPADAPEVTVLDRGASPRRELRYDLPLGTTQTLEFRTYTDISQRIGKRIARGGSPNITFTIVATVTDVAPTGDLRIDYRYDDVDVTQTSTGNTEQTRELVEQIVGLTGSITITDTGEALASSQQIPDGVDPEVQTLLEQVGTQTSQLAAPLPEPAMGVGARWRVAQQPELGGIQFTQTAVYTLERRSGSKVVLSSKVTQRARRQEFTPAGADEALVLLSSKGEGTGDTTLQLAKQPLPVDGDSTFRVDQRLRDGDQTINQVVTTNIFLNH
jgi:hypothetical protein